MEHRHNFVQVFDDILMCEVPGCGEFRSQAMTEEIEHGPLAGYSSDGSEYMPFIDCLCGWSSGRCNSFAIAGEDFDEHMKEALPR